MTLNKLALLALPALLAVIVATSYITLSVVDTTDAERLWWPYAIVTCVLAYVNFALWWRHSERERERRRDNTYGC